MWTLATIYLGAQISQKIYSPASMSDLICIGLVNLFVLGKAKMGKCFLFGDF
jgi:hypothetical protein